MDLETTGGIPRLLMLMTLAPVFGGSSALSASPTSVAAIEHQLAWVENADPVTMVQEDARAGNLRFLSVCGITCALPAIGEITVERCYPSVEVQRIEGTTDAPRSERHAALNRRAEVVAGEYNRLAVHSPAFQSRSVCPPGADWESAFQELISVTREAYPELGNPDLMLQNGRPRFLLVLEQDALTAGFETSVCAVLHKYNLPGSVHIAVIAKPGAAESSARVLCSGTNPT